MSGIIYKAAAGAMLQQVRLEMLSNNLANVNTIGFKEDNPVFRFQESTETNSATSAGVPKLSPYVSPMDYATNHSSGTLRKTGNPLDAAIAGDGFFEIKTADGLQYTRKGCFSVNEQGLLTTATGDTVMGQGGTIEINGSSIEISEQGEISVDGNLVDVLRVVDFEKVPERPVAPPKQPRSSSPSSAGTWSS